MAMQPPPPGSPCPGCGTLPGPAARFCESCGRPLTSPVPGSMNAPVAPPARAGSPPGSEVNAVGLILLISGSVMALFGVSLLVGSAFVASAVAQQQQFCQQHPPCPSPMPDPSLGLAVGGAILLIVALVLLVVGIQRLRR